MREIDWCDCVTPYGGIAVYNIDFSKEPPYDRVHYECGKPAKRPEVER